MTIVKIGRKGSKTSMEFEFQCDYEAYRFFTKAKESYREDDLKVSMYEEEEPEDPLLESLIDSGVFVRIKKGGANENIKIR